MREYIYTVNGTEYRDTVAFGDAWKNAKAQATNEHAYITRVIVKGDEIVSNEFFAKGGCFLNDKGYNYFLENAKVF